MALPLSHDRRQASRSQNAVSTALSGARYLSGRALSYLYAPKADARWRRRAALAEVRPRGRTRRHRNAFPSATARFRRSRLTRTGRKIRGGFFPASRRILLFRLG